MTPYHYRTLILAVLVGAFCAAVIAWEPSEDDTAPRQITREEGDAALRQYIVDLTEQLQITEAVLEDLNGSLATLNATLRGMQ